MKSLNINRYIKYYPALLLGILMIANSGCDEFLEIAPPKTEIVNSKVFEEDASAVAAIRGIYSMMLTNNSFTNGEMERYTGLSADELINYASQIDQQQFATPALTPNNQIILSMFWKEAYAYILNANAMLEGIGNSTGMTDAVKTQLEGEAKFIRAFCHLQLTVLFGEIPYITSTDYRLTGSATRQSVDVVFQKIIKDLKEAQAMLPDGFTHANNQRIQPNRSAATALLARVYLYNKEWENAENEASQVINNNTFALNTLDKVFLANSTETILQLKPVLPGTNTRQATLFFLSRPPTSSVGRVALDSAILKVFELDDQRKELWIGEFLDGSNSYFYPTKYKAVGQEVQSEYSTILRLAEQYLIRAEARTQQNKIAEALEDIDMVRTRAGLTPLAIANPSISQADLLLAIEQERRVELFTEGHRWIDLIRTDRANALLETFKLDWQPTDQLYPIPESERLLNPAITQNPGY